MKKMNPVICFGEALVDFLNIGQYSEPPLSLNEFRQYPGGAPANVAVAIAKLGGNAFFAGQVGHDSFGNFLQQALEVNNVDTSFMYRHPSAMTPLAFVMLDSQGERSFSFYRDKTADLLFDKTQVKKAWFTSSSLFHFCSNTLTEKNITETTQYALSLAKTQGAIISFDVNLRANLWSDMIVEINKVNQFAQQADVLKYSKDELHYLAEGDEKAYIKNLLSAGVSLILVTDGAETIHYYCERETGQIIPPSVKVIDTTAGGDAFIGAFLFGLSQIPQGRAFLSAPHLFKPLINFSANCGAHAVTQPGAFPALPTFQDVNLHWHHE